MNAHTIMVVDDDPLVRRFLEGRLKLEGFRVLCAEGGAEALRILGEEDVELVLLDVSMPGMSGYDVLETMRRDARTLRVPVMFLTVMDSREEERRGLREGVIDYLSKEILAPERIDILIYRIRNFFTWQENERLRGILATIVSANHEINNPLTVILGTAERLAMFPWIAERGEATPLLERIVDQSLKIKECLERISHLNTWASRPYVDGVEMLDLKT
jgi:DNA-binding response OmpR family regulator